MDVQKKKAPAWRRWAAVAAATRPDYHVTSRAVIARFALTVEPLAGTAAPGVDLP